MDQHNHMTNTTAEVNMTVTVRQPLTMEAVAIRVMGAVVAVLGRAVGPHQPLVEAGLDSLGQHPICSKEVFTAEYA